MAEPLLTPVSRSRLVGMSCRGNSASTLLHPPWTCLEDPANSLGSRHGVDLRYAQLGWLRANETGEGSVTCFHGASDFHTYDQKLSASLSPPWEGHWAMWRDRPSVWTGRLQGTVGLAAPWGQSVGAPAMSRAAREHQGGSSPGHPPWDGPRPGHRPGGWARLSAAMAEGSWRLALPQHHQGRG